MSEKKRNYEKVAIIREEDTTVRYKVTIKIQEKSKLIFFLLRGYSENLMSDSMRVGEILSNSYATQTI